jgi:thiosulfate dehydrogenase [quinone] large subunit
MTTEPTECCQAKESTECCKATQDTECCDSCPQTNLGLIYGAWLLRVWLAVRAIQTGVEKFAGMKGSDQPITIDGKVNEYGLTSATNIKEYAMSHYHGVPEALMKKFTDEPLMLKFALPLYDKVLGPALLVLGLTILLGIASRTSLFLLGLLYISLTWGLILIKEDSGVAWLGIHMIMIVMALWLSKYNRLCVLKKW